MRRISTSLSTDHQGTGKFRKDEQRKQFLGFSSDDKEDGGTIYKWKEAGLWPGGEKVHFKHTEVTVLVGHLYTHALPRRPRGRRELESGQCQGGGWEACSIGRLSLDPRGSIAPWLGI